MLAPTNPVNAADVVTVLVVPERVEALEFLVGLARSDRYRAVGLTTDVSAAATAAHRQHPDVVVAEVGSLDRLHELGPAGLLETAPTVVVSEVPAEVALLTAMAAGARGFVRKPPEDGVLEQAVSAVAAGHVFVDSRSAHWLVALALQHGEGRSLTGLTLRQTQVVELVRAGLSNREIAQALGVGPETVKTHLQEAMRKLGAHNRRQATRAVGPGSAHPA